MQRLLIPLFVCLVLGAPSILFAQDAQKISVASPQKAGPHLPGASPDMMCNFAGTYTFIQFNGASNDIDLPQIFLCANDEFLLRHNGDAILNGDPIPATTPGIAYAQYICLPTVMGDNLQAIAAPSGDACVLNVPPSIDGLYMTPGVANGGDTWFTNNGATISTFGLGQPISIFYAPITVDQITPPFPLHESVVVGAPPGPCVNVNTAAAFEVIYLNPITQNGINNAFGDDCLGKFNIRGGYPEYDNAAIYTINIALTSNPSVKAVIHTQQSQLFHNAPVIFSVSTAGNYTITVEDGKSCPATFTMDMSACVPGDNIVLSFPDTIAPPATSNFCIPLTVQNFDVVSSQFSINWDPTVLQYTGIFGLNPILDSVIYNTLNNSNASLGQLGLVIYDTNPVGNVLSVPDNETLFQVCFNVVGTIGQCTGINITNNPTGVAFEDAMGQTIALTADTGSVCIQFQPLNVQIAIIDSTCLGLGTMVVTATGGESPYQVIVHEFATGYDGPTNLLSITGSGSSVTLVDGVGNFNNLTYSYSVCVTDSNGIGITVCDTIDVLIPTLGAQIDFVQQPSCNGGSDGIVDAVILLAGVPTTDPSNFSFLWTPSTLTDPTSSYQNGPLNGDVFAGNYTLVITDNSRNCSASASGFLGQPTPISEDVVTLTQASCSGVANGSINYLVEGGTSFAGNQYQYSLVTADASHTPVGAPGQSNPIIINGVAAGNYWLIITDANGCVFVDSTNVNITDQRVVTLNPSAVLTFPSCFGLSDGGGGVTVTESNFSGADYTFTWLPAPVCTPFETNLSSLYACLSAGSYFVTAMDPVDGCMDTVTLTIGQPSELVLSPNGLQNPGCSQANSGSINVIAQGGSGGPNYTYTWDIPATGPNQSGLSVGDYSVTVTDVNGCQDSLDFTLTPPAPPALSIVLTPVKCGDDGALTANAPTAVLYNWEEVPSNGTIGDTIDITNLAGGTYAVTITDAVGCTAVDTVTLQDVTRMSFADTSFVQPLCFGDDDGILGVTVQDGQQPYVQYNWNPTNLNSPTIFGLTAGLYAVTVTDNVGCTLTGSFTLAQPPQVVNTISNVQDVSCFGVCDGTAEIVSNYATTPVTTGNFLYIWSDGLSTAAMRTDLCAGTYTVTSADNNSCGATSTIVIGTPPQVTGTVTATPATCFGLTNGSATVVASGGNGSPYTYLWSDANSSTTPTVVNLGAGQYVVTVTDVNGCTGILSSIFVTEPGEIMVSQDLTQTTIPKCFGDSNGVIVVSINGGNNGGFTFEWSDATGVVSIDSISADGLQAGIYSVVVTDSEGCTGSLAGMVLQDPPPVLGSYEDPAPLACFGDETTLRIESIAGGSGGPYQFSLDYGALLDIDFPVSLSGGDHYITYYDFKYCSYTDTITVDEPDEITVEFDPAVHEIKLGDTTYQLKPIISTGPNAVESFTWTPAEFLHWPDTLYPYVFTFESQTYTLVVVDEHGCSGTGSVVINVDPDRNVYIPNIFKPGVGGLNDHFNVYLGLGIDIVNYMRIYDRWGELMYTRERFLPNNDNFADGWDGKFKGDYVNPGVFVYIIEVKFLDGRVLLYRGDVTVIR